MLHKVNDRDDVLQLTLRPRLLDDVLAEIRGNHDLATLDSVDRDYLGEQAGSGLTIAITFDDGYLDNYEEALPILKRWSAPAMIYLSTAHIDGTASFWFEDLTAAIQLTHNRELALDLKDFGTRSLRTMKDKASVLLFLNGELKRLDQGRRDEIIVAIVEQLGTNKHVGRSAMLSWDQVREMAKQGIQFGSHTVNHSILSREKRSRIISEIQDSKKVVETQLNSPVRSFAYPNGTGTDFNPEVTEEVRHAGYVNACTTIPGINRSADTLFTLRRVALHNDMCTNIKGEFDRHLFWSKTLSIF